MQRTTSKLRALLRKKGSFLYMPSCTDPIAARLAQSMGCPAVYTGGYMTGGTQLISEPLLTMTEQIEIAGRVAQAVPIPLLADGGAGFGEPLHTMRSVREFIRAGIAGIHIEDQLFPKRAHYHKYVAHAIDAKEFQDKIRFACRARDETDKDFVIIARSDTCRFYGVKEAIKRVNMAADVGADLGLIFPRDLKETRAAPKLSRIPLVYVQSRGNRDGRPNFTNNELRDMGYVGNIDAQLLFLVAFAAWKRALAEVQKQGDYLSLSHEQFRDIRQEIEDLIGLEDFYRVEEETVEKKKWGKR
ncbi:MAG: isocitrate lyase/PEP mutase family protein [Alphaproteobacteria bacterium]|nr:isocitrate lyase/PEP mutase family protein [Alphaproteobacteria bacterium]